MVVGIVAAAGVAIGLDAKLLVALVLDLELGHFEFLQQPGSAFESMSSRLLQPIPYRIAAVIVADTAGRDPIAPIGWA